MPAQLTLYHGSERVIESPTFGAGKRNNDFGLGFYCTQSSELAKEWARIRGAIPSWDISRVCLPMNLQHC